MDAAPREPNFARGALVEGFGLIRRRPALLLTWYVLFLIMAVIGAVVLQWQSQMAFAAMVAGRSPASVTLETQVLVAAEALVSVVISSVVWTSAFRALLHPAERKPLGLGAPELRVLAARFITQLVSALPLLIVPLLAGLIHQPGLMAYAGPLALVVGLLGGLWAAVASVWAYDRRQIAPLRCWQGFKGCLGRFIPLFLAVGVVFVLIGGQTNRLAILINGGRPILARPTLETLLTAPILAQTLLTVAIITLQIAVLAGITAYAWRVTQSKAA